MEIFLSTSSQADQADQSDRLSWTAYEEVCKNVSLIFLFRVTHAWLLYKNGIFVSAHNPHSDLYGSLTIVAHTMGHHTMAAASTPAAAASTAAAAASTAAAATSTVAIAGTAVAVATAAAATTPSGWAPPSSPASPSPSAEIRFRISSIS